MQDLTWGRKGAAKDRKVSNTRRGGADKKLMTFNRVTCIRRPAIAWVETSEWPV